MSIRIIVAGPPKTGNVWIKHILAELYGLHIISPEPGAEVEELQSFLQNGQFPPDSIFQQHYWPTEEFLSLVAAEQIHLVTVLRNPYDAFVSLYHFVQNFPENFPPGHELHPLRKNLIDDPEIFAFIARVQKGFGIHLQLAYEWLASERSQIVRYEDLQLDPFPEVARLASRIAPVEEAAIRAAIEASSAEKMRKRSNRLSRHIRKAKVGDWKNHLSEEHLQVFRANHADLIEKLGYEVIDHIQPGSRRNADPTFPSMNETRLFNDYYFAHGCGRPYERDEHWLTFFDTIGEQIVRDIQPASALDAGCAMGFLVEALRARDVEAWGVDISEYAIEHVDPSIAAHCWVGSVLEPFPRRYDLIICIEVLEHLPKPDSEKALSNLCQHTDDILFSSSPDDYAETTHFNVQPPEYWAELFAHQGFYRDLDFDASFITPWAARFRRSERLAPARIVKGYERRFWGLWRENVALRKTSVEFHDRLTSFERQTKAMDVELQQLRQKYAETQHHLDGVLHSRSWRMMTRLQKVVHLLAPPDSLRARVYKGLIAFFGSLRK